MWLTTLGGSGAWPTASQPCSGYLIEHAGFRVLIDPGYATLPALLSLHSADAVDAVLVSHGHPDHCADLNPLLRARALGDVTAPPLPVFAPPGALDAVLALDREGMLADAYEPHDLEMGRGFGLGPLRVDTFRLPHHVPNAGLRLTSPDGTVLAYTGDSGPSSQLSALAEGADLLLAEATYPTRVPAEDAKFLLTARLAGQYAAAARPRRLELTHLWPGTSPHTAWEAAGRGYDGPVGVAVPGRALPVGPPRSP